MNVAWTDEAKAHLDGIHQYISRDVPLYATQMVDKLTRRVDQLIDHPRSGRIVPKYDD
ncbi:MAG: type II toxin-antitoxin system RelE/ParE family toxin [Sulfuricaulis sp.]